MVADLIKPKFRTSGRENSPMLTHRDQQSRSELVPSNWRLWLRKFKVLGEGKTDTKPGTRLFEVLKNILTPFALLR